MSNQNEQVDESSSFRDLVARINLAYSDPRFENSDDAEILADLLLPHLQDRKSGVSLLSLMHLNDDDIDCIMDYPNESRIVISDYTKIARRLCRQVIAGMKEKLQSDKDSFTIERILRQSVKDLEDKNVRLENEIVHLKSALAEEKLKNELNREDIAKLSAKVAQAKKHLDYAEGVFDAPSENESFTEVDNRRRPPRTHGILERPRWRL